MINSLFREVTLRSICAVWRRHARIYLRTWVTNCLAPISEPIFYLIGFGLGLRPMLGEIELDGRHIDYLHFLAPGMIVVGTLMQSFFEGVYGTFVRFRYLRVWQAMLSTPLAYGDVFLGDLTWAASKGTLAGLATGLVAICWGVLTFRALIFFLPYIIVASLIFAAIGMLSAGLIRTIDQVNIPTFLIIVPMPLFCGGYFPRTTLGGWADMIFQYIPFAILVDEMRAIEFASSNSFFTSLLLLLLWMLILVSWAAKTLRAKVIS